MKILAIMGGPRKLGNTYLVTRRIEAKLKELDSSIEVDYLFLRDAVIQMCSGCRLCFNQGEVSCPHKDDIPAIVAKMIAADGVIFASPTYVGNMTGFMKNLMDRLAYFCHRPAFFNKQALFVTTTGSAGAMSALIMMRIPVGTWGFHTAAQVGVCVNTGEIIPVPEKLFRKIDKAAVSFHQALHDPKSVSPSLFGLIAFQANRKYHRGKDTYDARYWREKGWLEPERNYFNGIKVNLFKRFVAYIMTKVLSLT